MKIAKNEIKQRVENCVVEILRISRQTFQTNKGLTWEELGADSLNLVELVMSFEEEFETDFSDELAETIRTPKQAIKHLCKVYG